MCEEIVSLSLLSSTHLFICKTLVFICTSQVPEVWRASITALISVSSKSVSAAWNLIDTFERLGYFTTNVSADTL